MSQTPGTILLRCLVVFLTILLSFAIADRTSGIFAKKYTATVTMEVRPETSTNSGLASRSPSELVRERIFDNDVLALAITEQGHTGLERELALGKLRSALAIKEIRNTRLVQISVSAKTPAEAASLANSLAANLQQALMKMRSAEIEVTLGKLKAELARQREKVEALRAAATQIRVEARIIDLDPDHAQKSGSLDVALADLKSEINSLQAIQEKLASLSDEDALKEIVNATYFGKSLDPTMSEIAAGLQSLKTESSTLVPNTPEAKAAESRIQKLDAQLRGLLPILRNRIESKLISKKQLLQSASALIAADRTADPEQAENYRKAKEEYLREKALLEQAETKLQTEEMQISSPQSICTIWERAEPPTRPAGPPALILALILLAGLLIGTALAFLPRPGIVASILFILLIVAITLRWMGSPSSQTPPPASAPPPSAPASTTDIRVNGKVLRPGPISHSPGLTLLTAIHSAGGFDQSANKKKVSLSRAGKIVVIDMTLILSDPSKDVPVKPGDIIEVP